MNNTRRDGRRGAPSVCASAAVLVVGTLIAAFAIEAAATQPAKQPGDPWAGLSDQQKQALVDETHAKNVKFLEDFQAKHGDPRSLRVITLSGFQGPPASMGAAAAKAEIIMNGKVESVHFTADPTGNLPHMSAVVRVSKIGKGSLSSSSVVVSQLGGPVAQLDGKGALVRLDGEELVLPGDDVLLLLNASGPVLPQYRTVYGAGVLFLRNGRALGEAAKRYGLDGQASETVWRTLTDPALAPAAFPLRNSSD
jgi:hypothetical protein